MQNKSGIKKKIIVWVIAIAAIALLIGSFFLRDLLIRTGVTEYERSDIVQVKSKYSKIIEEIISHSEEYDSFEITAFHGGLFQKSVIDHDENGKRLYESITEPINVLCHTYCYKIHKNETGIYFSFNARDTKRLVYTASKPEMPSADDMCEKLDENWYYTENTFDVKSE